MTKSFTSRMPAVERRSELLDAGLEILREGGTEDLTIGLIAERCKVTRALVYKHFANSQDLIDSVFSREAAKLHSLISAKVNNAEGFESRVRAFAEAVLSAVDTHGWIFGVNHPVHVKTTLQATQRNRDQQVVRFFAQLVVEEFGIPLRTASSAMAILLSGVRSLRDQARLLTSEKDQQFLADIYVDLVIGGLSRIANKRGLSALVHPGSVTYLKYGDD